jgi:hypothetical protein
VNAPAGTTSVSSTTASDPLWLIPTRRARAYAGKAALANTSAPSACESLTERSMSSSSQKGDWTSGVK